MPHELSTPNTIYIETRPTFVMDFVMTPETKREFFESAYKQTQQSLLVRELKERQWLKTAAARRHSFS
jgi:hypothetical protein